MFEGRGGASPPALGYDFIGKSSERHVKGTLHLSGATIVSKRKGDFLERIIAELHRVPGVHVTRSARLKSSSYRGRGRGRGREIDVLLEANVAGYEIQIAIECKNEREKIGAPKIDAFAGKLHEVGIPTKYGIFVSSSGFTSDALRAATAHNIRPLVLTGLALDGLRNEVKNALCSTVYLLASVVNCNILSKSPIVSDSELQCLFVDGKFSGMVPDGLAQLWIQGQIPSDLGKHPVELPLEPGTHQVAGGKRVEVLRITAEIEVVGLVLREEGTTVRHALIDPINKEIHKVKERVEFPTLQSGKVPIGVVRTEDEIRHMCVSNNATSVVTRVRLPRIIYGSAYWPLSQRAMVNIKKAAEAYLLGIGPHPSELKFRDIEGDDLAEIYRF